MATAVVMPRQGQSVETCFITSWHKSKGDKIEKGDILFSYETDKAAFDEEAPESGVLLDIFFAEGDEVPVLETVAVIGQPGEKYGEPASGKTASESPDGSHVKDSERPEGKPADVTPGESAEVLPGKSVDMTPGKPAASEGEPAKPRSGQPGIAREDTSVGGRIRISPLAKKQATEQGLSLTDIKGSGPQGRIIERDIKKATGNKKPVKEPPVEESMVRSEDEGNYTTGLSAKDTDYQKANDFVLHKLTNMRRIIARKMEESLQNSAQLTHHMSADARQMLAWRKQVKAGSEKAGSVDISINDMVCYAVIRALKKHAYMNAHFIGEGIRIFNKVHLGIAVDTERGLMVPVIRNADDMNIGGLAGRISSLAEECRKGSVDPELLSSANASFTVTNLGVYGVELFTPVLNLPQAGILGVNTITYRPADLGDGVIGFIPVIGLSLTYDHRAVDGAPASAFLAEVKKEIESIESHRI